jgi:hypothetical protein
VILGGFQLPEVRKRKKKNHQLSMPGFQCSQKHKTMIKDLFFISGLQPDFTKSSGDDPHTFLHCLWMTIATFAANINS